MREDVSVRKRVRLASSVALVSLGSCALLDGEGEAEISVLVVRGIELAPADMRGAHMPVARYLQMGGD